MPKKLRIGFIGTGGIAGGLHLPGYQALDTVEIVAAADISRNALDAFSAKAGIPEANRFSDYQEMLEKVPLDAVSVCTPNYAHAAASIAALKAGVNVLCEKPAATCADELREMIAAAKESGKLLMIGQTLRFSAGAQQMKHWVDKGELGEIYFGRAQYLRVRGAPGSPGFISKDLAAGGPIYDIGVHALDLTLWLMDFPEPTVALAGVYNRIACQKSPLNGFDPADYTVPEDSAFSLVRFANGATVILECSWLLNIPNGVHNVVLCGDKGGCQLEPTQLVRERNGVLEKVTNEIFPYQDRGWGIEEVRAFVEAIRKRKPSPVPAEQALVTQRILDAIYRSGETGREVEA